MSEFRKYTREELVKFVRSMDRVIEEPTEILVIGGAAAALKDGATASTKDIDTWHAVPRAVARAAAEARAETGLPVPIEKAGVSDGPYHYEDRIQTVSMRLKKLRILVPERHDLALMKVVRGDRHDEDMIAEIHAHNRSSWTCSSSGSRTRWATSRRTSGSCERSSARWCLDCSAQRPRGAFPRSESQAPAGCAFRRRASAAEHHSQHDQSAVHPRGPRNVPATSLARGVSQGCRG